jgi:hypothetical protein
VNGSLQTLERPTHSPAPDALSEALERFDRTSVRLGLDSATTGLGAPQLPVFGGLATSHSTRRNGLLTRAGP